MGWVVLIERLRSKARLWEGKEKEDSEKAIVDSFHEECLRMMFFEGTRLTNPQFTSLSLRENRILVETELKQH